MIERSITDAEKAIDSDEHSRLAQENQRLNETLRTLKETHEKREEELKTSVLRNLTDFTAAADERDKYKNDLLAKQSLIEQNEAKLQKQLLELDELKQKNKHLEEFKTIVNSSIEDYTKRSLESKRIIASLESQVEFTKQEDEKLGDRITDLENDNAQLDKELKQQKAKSAKDFLIEMLLIFTLILASSCLMATGALILLAGGMLISGCIALGIGLIGAAGAVGASYKTGKHHSDTNFATEATPNQNSELLKQPDSPTSVMAPTAKPYLVNTSSQKIQETARLKHSKPISPVTSDSTAFNPEILLSHAKTGRYRFHQGQRESAPPLIFISPEAFANTLKRNG